MAARKITKKSIVLFYIVLFGYSCTYTRHKYPDTEMIRVAEEYRELFHKQEISRIELRSNYYVCFYNNSADYIVSCDCMLIKTINKNPKIISANAPNDTTLSNRLQVLLAIVEDVYAHQIRCVSVDSDTIRIERFNGYYITNFKPYSNGELRKVENGWYVKDAK